MPTTAGSAIHSDMTLKATVLPQPIALSTGTRLVTRHLAGCGGVPGARLGDAPSNDAVTPAVTRWPTAAGGQSPT
jgi:hypothetical protein